MPRHKGFSASVRVDKKALDEYVVETKDDSVTSWVVSEEGQVRIQRRIHSFFSSNMLQIPHVDI